jgi:AraC family transcriptional regulator, regulatory protein of adaptative response / methylated-DNA-[protein]-cysteine methyltransferase
MRRAFLSGDASYDGVFFTAVKTTGIFCAPSCKARKPLPENIEFFPSIKAAMFAGYRACKRCKPEQGSSAPEWVQGLLEKLATAEDGRIKEAELRSMGFEPARVRRYFEQQYGMTFQAFARARRLGRALEQIRDSRMPPAKIDDAVFDAGYESHSGFREAFAKQFGVPPGQADAAACIKLAWMDTPMGPMVAGAVEDGICLLEFTDRRMLETQFKRITRSFKAVAVPGENRHLAQLREELAAYFDGKLKRFRVPLKYPGSPFELEVWRELLELRYGATCSYQDLAQKLGRAGASRAVGSANGRNRIAIVIPCHRVVNANGELGGYGGGLWRKKLLLELEKRN